MADTTFDVIVVGLGAMGSAATYHLARRGQRVLGLDAHPVGHTLGSSHGETRIIRQAYFEHPNYVPLVQRAYELWQQLESDSQTRLLHITGGLFIGPPEGSLVGGSLLSAHRHHLAHALLDAADIRKRYPAFQARSTEVGLFEDRAGMLLPEACIEAHLRLAEQAGAVLRHSEGVRGWSAAGDNVTVQTAAATYNAAKLVVAAGAWTSKLLPGVPVQAERIPLYWFTPARDAAQFETLPIWIWQSPEHGGEFFGTPHLSWPGVKVGKHHSQVIVDPDVVDRTISSDDELPLRAFVASRMPDLNGPVADARVCLYENSPDTDFLVDVHPNHPNVVYAAGFSGHGFKFASVIGEILADLTVTGQTTPDAAFFRAARLASPTSDP